MGHTNATPNYNLPQFLGSDKPAWLTDINNAMSAIDTAIAAAKAAADNAGGAAAALSETVAGHTTQLTTLGNTVTTQGTTIVSQGNAINTISELIGNGTPTTTDKTLIGAINELNGEIENADIVDQTPGNTYTGSFNALAVQFSANQGFSIPIQLPFKCKNTNYTASVTVNKIGAVAATTETLNTISDKGTDSFNAGLFYANVTAEVGVASFAVGTYTITFA